MFEDIRRFVAAVFDHWGTLVFGSVASTLLLIYPKAISSLGHPEISELLPVIVKWAGFPLTVFCACFLAWRSEYRKCGELNEQLNQLTRPRLRLELNQINLGDVEDDTGITLVVGVMNDGAPSVCDFCPLKITTVEGNVLEVPLQWADKDTPIRLGYGDSYVTFPGTDFLPAKTASQPVQQGARERGLVLFRLRNMKKEPLARAGTKLELSCRDVNGNISSITTIMKGSGKNEPLMYTGTTPRLMHGALPATPPGPIQPP